MHFRYKVIMVNITFLSIGLGILGFIIIHQNFRQAFEIQLSYAVEENNLIQSSIEYQLLDVLNSPSQNFIKNLADIGDNTNSSILSQLSSFYIVCGRRMVYNNNNPEDNDLSLIPEDLFSSLELGSKNYILCREKEDYFIYVTSKNIVNKQDLYIITKRNTNDTYQLLYSQIHYFSLLMVIVLAISSVFLYFISQHLTNPLEQLNTITDYFARGNYAVRADISSDDEVGMLSAKFNDMASSVSEHIEELNTMVKQREQFVADFTHEIKTPMTTIIGYADMLRNKNVSEERRQLAYQYIYSEGKRLETMSMKLFDLIYLGKSEIMKTEIDTTSFAQEIAQSMQPILNRKEILLEIDIDPAIVWGEPELLKTVFINLIDNARKASHEKSHILFRGKTEKDYYIFEVKDWGCGMDAETVLHICDEFYMADKSRTREEGGAGLGMSLVSIILKKHGAELEIKSSPGNGTTISIMLFSSNIMIDKETAQ